MYPSVQVKNDQEAFNVIRDHLLAQGRRSVNYNYDCVYRGMTNPSYTYDDIENEDFHHLLDGSACAVGCLIADGVYDSIIEGDGVASREVLDQLRSSNPDWDISDQSITFLTNMQFLHDRLDPALWPEILPMIAFQNLIDVEYQKVMSPFVTCLNNLVNRIGIENEKD